LRRREGDAGDHYPETKNDNAADGTRMGYSPLGEIPAPGAPDGWDFDYGAWELYR
jgi:hypothetical protein